MKKDNKLIIFLKNFLFSLGFLIFFILILKRLNFKPDLNLFFFIIIFIFLFVFLFFKKMVLSLSLLFNNLILPLRGRMEKFKFKIFIKIFSALLFLIIFIIGVTYDIFIYKSSSSIILIFLIILWILLIKYFKYSKNVSFIISAILIFFSPFLVISGKITIAEKMAFWAFFFISFGLFQFFIEIVRKRINGKIK